MISACPAESIIRMSSSSRQHCTPLAGVIVTSRRRMQNGSVLKKVRITYEKNLAVKDRNDLLETYTIFSLFQEYSFHTTRIEKKPHIHIDYIVNARPGGINTAFNWIFWSEYFFAKTTQKQRRKNSDGALCYVISIFGLNRSNFVGAWSFLALANFKFNRLPII